MTLARYQFTVTDDEGNVIPSASVEVRREATGSPIVSLYSDRNGVTPIGNPFSADADGYAAFHVAGGAYRITATSGSFSRVWRYVGIGLAQESDSLTTGISWTFSSTTTDSDPGEGFVQFNNATLASVTQIYFDNTTALGAAATAWLDTFDDGGTSADRGILFLQASDASGLMIARVTGSVTDGTGYRKVTVTPVTTSGAFVPGITVNAFFIRSPADATQSGYRFNFDSTTSMADPGTGDFRLNNGTLSSVTAAAVSDLSSETGNPDVSVAVLAWDDSSNSIRGTLVIKKAVAPQNFAVYNITGASTDNSGWTQLALTYVTHAGSFSNGDACTIDFSRAGNQGTIGGTTGSTANALLRADGTGGATAKATGITVDDSNNLTGATSLAMLDTNASHNLKIIPGSNITQNRTLTLTTGDADRTLTLNADITPAGQGKQTCWIPATAMMTRTTNGAAAGTVEMATNKNMFKTLDFDTTTQEFAQFEVFFPKSWDLGTVTFQPVLSHASGSGNVVFGLAGVARGSGDAGDVAFGTAQTSDTTVGTANAIYIGPESSAITIAGTPTAGDTVQFQINRTVASDNLGVDARLHGIRLFFTTNAATDA